MHNLGQREQSFKTGEKSGLPASAELFKKAARKYFLHNLYSVPF